MTNYTKLLQTSHKFVMFLTNVYSLFQLDSAESRPKKQCLISVEVENQIKPGYSSLMKLAENNSLFSFYVCFLPCLL